MLASSQPLAVQAGLSMLEKGGSAADAAGAAAAVLNVTEPTSTGIGGDCFALYYSGSSHEITALNGSGRAPAALTLDLLRRQGLAERLPPFHIHTVTVPGAPAGWCDLVARHGRLPLKRLLAPAIRLAEEGFPVSPITAYFWARGAERQLRHAPGGHALTIDGRAPRAGEVFRNPGLARALRLLAEGGASAFYEGEIADAILALSQRAGGAMTARDLAQHRSTWDAPISTTYRGLRVWECPPNGQGLATLLALNILEGIDLAAHPPLGATRLHWIVEALRLAFADARRFVADPAFAAIPLNDLLSKEYATERRRLIDPRRASMNQAPGDLRAATDTVYLTAVDGEGSACSFISSNYMGFGTGMAPEGFGFTLQNRGYGFSLDPAHPNALGPGKRPYHTIIPALATRADGSLFASFGVMGGFMQPQGHVQVLSGLVDDGLDPQEALDRARVCLEEGTPSSPLALEEGIQPATLRRLGQKGHQIRLVRGMERALFGRGQIITREGESAVLCGGSDPRADGCAAALA